jgi:hypothetical protein
MKKGLLVMAMLVLVSTLALAACSQYATCPHDGQTAVLVESHFDGNGSWVATYAHTHKDDRGQTFTHQFTRICDTR